jgi:hypothetical protein
MRDDLEIVYDHDTQLLIKSLIIETIENEARSFFLGAMIYTIFFDFLLFLGLFVGCFQSKTLIYE